MKLLVTMSDPALIDKLDENLEQAGQEVLRKGAGQVSLSHKKINDNQIEIEMIMLMENFITNKVIKKFLEKQLRKADPNCKVEKVNYRNNRTKPSAIPHHSWVGQGRQEKP